MWDRNGDTADATAAGIEAAGGRAVGMAVDVSDRPGIDAAVIEVRESLGPPLILVNNAGHLPVQGVPQDRLRRRSTRSSR